MSLSVNLLRIFLCALLASMVGSFIWMGSQSNFPDALARIWSEPWGKGLFLDLYVGFVLFTAWVGYRERCWWKTALWFVAICGLGNLATLAYLLWALRGIRTSSDLPRFFLGRSAGVSSAAAILPVLVVLMLGNVAAADDPTPAPTPTVQRVHGVSFPTSAIIGKESLPMRGTGTLRWLGFKVYTAALYVRAEVNTREGLLTNAPRRLEFHYHTEIKASEFRESTEKILSRHLGGDLKTLRARLDSLYAAYDTVKKGDSYTLTYEPAVGTTLALNGVAKVTIPGEDFARAYFGIWIGDDPLSESLVADLQGGKTATENR